MKIKSIKAGVLTYPNLEWGFDKVVLYDWTIYGIGLGFFWVAVKVDTK